jgi:hypothetical protein
MQMSESVYTEHRKSNIIGRCLHDIVYKFIYMALTKRVLAKTKPYWPRPDIDIKLQT